MMKKIIPFVLLLMAVLTAACSKEENTFTPDEPAIPVENIAFGKSEVKITIGQTRKLSAHITPANATNKGVTISSSDEEVVTVDKGTVVIGVKEGSAIVTIRTVDGGKTATCMVKVVSELTYYAVGDRYPKVGATTGIVFWLDPVTMEGGKGYEGKVVSLDEASSWWGTSGVVAGTKDEQDGAVNRAIVESIEKWNENYPTFKWCAGKGEQWYLPAIGELIDLYGNKELVNAVLGAIGGASPLSDMGYYWASTEYNESGNEETAAWCIRFADGRNDEEGTWMSKTNPCRVRAVSAF